MSKKEEKKEMVFDNKVQLVGRVTKKDEFVNFVPFAVFGIEIEVPIEAAKTALYHFNVPEGDEPTDYFSFRIIFLNNESIIEDVQIGDLVSVKGELQSRNFYQQHPMTDDLLQSSVEIYQNIFQKLPTIKPPTQHMRQPIHWKALMDMQLLEQIPTDSLFDENNKPMDDSNKPYMYKVDWNGQVTKETEENILEVVCFGYDFLDELPTTDTSAVLVSGRISNEPIFDIEENGNIYIQFKVQSYQKAFEPKEKRYMFTTVRIAGIEAEEILTSYKKNDFVTLFGTLVSERKTMTIKIKKLTAANKMKKKKVTIKKTDRFILSQVSYLKKQ